MNIFKILACGDGSINEPNISAFIGYLLNPNEDHGMGATFLRQILLEHYNQNKEVRSLKNLFDEKTNQIKDLSPGSGFIIDVFLEQGFKNTMQKFGKDLITTTDNDNNDYTNCTKKKEIVDILVFIYESKIEGKEDLAIQQLTESKVLNNILLIEVKINSNSAKSKQLANQIANSKIILGKLNEEKDLIVNISESVLKEISMIYITPKGCQQYFDELNTPQFITHPKSHIIWSAIDNIYLIKEENKEDLENRENNNLEDEYEKYSIETILNKIINNDFVRKIERIPEYTAQTLQSFSNFIYVGFTSKNKHKPGGDINKFITAPERIFEIFGKHEGKAFLNFKLIYNFIMKEFPEVGVRLNQATKGNTPEYSDFVTFQISNTNAKKFLRVEFSRSGKFKFELRRQYESSNETGYSDQRVSIRSGKSTSDKYYCITKQIDSFQESEYPLILDSYKYATNSN